MIFLSEFQVKEILDARDRGEPAVDVSLDLGRTKNRVLFQGDYLVLPDKQKVRLDNLERALGESTCFAVKENEIAKIHFFLPETQRFYRLVATGAETPPTAEISGVRMHRTKEVDPLSDAQSKIDAIKPVSGRVLDTCTGLGYTAIKARSAGADEVYTIEEDEGMMMLCELNPWSSEIFDERIRKIRGSTLEDVKKFKDEFFSAVIHDPPRFGLAGKLYSTEFYRELHRILKEGGKLFHYVGSPGGKYRSRDLPSGVMKRLKDAGFQNIKKQNQALGITARKK